MQKKKKIQATHLLLDFSKASDSLLERKWSKYDKHIGSPGKLLQLYASQNHESKGCSHDEDTNFFTLSLEFCTATHEHYIYSESAPRLCSSNIDGSSKRKLHYSRKKQEADNIHQKL